MKLAVWERALAAGVFCAFLLCFAAEARKSSVSEKMIRLHVKANSDEICDQQLKLLVRDAVLKQIAGNLSGQDIAAVREELANMLPEIEDLSEEVVRENNFDYPVEATLSNKYFPTRRYEDFSLPAGNYETLYIEIGEGAGENWWCVLFPPLCIAASEGESIESKAADAGLTEEDVSFIKEDTPSVRIGFKVAEIYGELKHTLFD